MEFFLFYELFLSFLILFVFTSILVRRLIVGKLILYLSWTSIQITFILFGLLSMSFMGIFFKSHLEFLPFIILLHLFPISVSVHFCVFVGVKGVCGRTIPFFIVKEDIESIIYSNNIMIIKRKTGKDYMLDVPMKKIPALKEAMLNLNEDMRIEN